MAIHRPRFKLGMELAAEEPGMAFELDDLDKVAIRRQAAQHHAFGAELSSIAIIEFIAMAVAFGDLLLAVELRRQRLVLQNAGISPQAHGAAFGVNSFLLFHKMNDGMRGVHVELSGIGALQPADIAGKLDPRHLHAQTNAKERNAIFTRVTDRRDLALAASGAESHRDENPVDVFEHDIGGLLFDHFRLDIAELDPDLVGNAAMDKRLQQTLVRLFETH